MYTEKEYNTLVDEHFEEMQKLKSDKSVLETENKSLDAQVKKLKDELAKRARSSTATSPTRTIEATTSASSTARNERRA